MPRISANPGIDAKFCQNPTAMQSLLETGDKVLVECAKDNVWGNGYPLGHPNSLRSQTWKSKGILGTILEEIRDYHISQAKTMPWMNIGAWSQQPRLPPPSSSALFNSDFPPIGPRNTSPPLRQHRPMPTANNVNPTPTLTSSPMVEGASAMPMRNQNAAPV